MSSVHREYVLAVEALKSYAKLRSDNALAKEAGVNQSRLSLTLRDPSVTVTTDYIATLLAPFGITLDTFFLWGRQALEQEKEREALALKRHEEQEGLNLRIALAEGNEDAVAKAIYETGAELAARVHSRLGKLIKKAG